jgi:hypothetical protein
VPGPQLVHELQGYTQEPYFRTRGAVQVLQTDTLVQVLQLAEQTVQTMLEGKNPSGQADKQAPWCHTWGAVQVWQ